jgi:uncharacterized membrane protein
MRVGVLGLVVLAAGTAARADLTMCNRDDVRHSVAVAYIDGAAWVSEGWWGIEPGACKAVLPGKLAQRHYYYTLSDVEDFAGDGFAFCVTDQAFTLLGADGDCAALGGEARAFSHIDTGPTADDFSFDLIASPKGEVEAPAAFQQGTYGEPFTVTGLMQGCDAEGCSFYAEGVRWMALKAGPSSAEALAAMAELPVNAPVIVSGDEISLGDITVEAAVSRVEAGEPDGFAAMRAAMQGDWVSEEDAQAKLTVYGAEQTDVYGDEVLGVSVVTFADACPGGEVIGPVFYTQMMGGDPGDLPCYAVVEMTPVRMELSYVGRGNTLVYVRPQGD